MMGLSKHLTGDQNDSKQLWRSSIINEMPTIDEVTFALYQSGVLSELQIIQLLFPDGYMVSNDGELVSEIDASMQDRVLVEACYKSHERLANMLLTPYFFDDHTGHRASVASTVAQIAIARDLLHVIRFYVEMCAERECMHHIVVWACQRPSRRTQHRRSSIGSNDVCARSSRARESCHLIYRTCSGRLLIDDEYHRIFDSLMRNVPTSWWVGRYLGKAAKCGNLYAVERLLDCEHIDPSAYENDALCQASRYGHIEVVRRLLRDPRIDPASFGHRALGVARSFDQVEIARLLVESSRITFQCISVQDSMEMAVEAHNTKLVVALLADGRASLSNAQIITLLGNLPTQLQTEQQAQA